MKGEDGSIIDSQSSIVDQIYDQYMEAYKKGVFNYIKEDYDRLSDEVIPRKYFSGGIKGDIKLARTGNQKNIVSSAVGENYQLAMEVSPQKDGSSSPISGDFFRKRKIKKMIKEKLARPGKEYLIADSKVREAMQIRDGGHDFGVEYIPFQRHTERGALKTFVQPQGYGSFEGYGSLVTALDYVSEDQLTEDDYEHYEVVDRHEKIIIVKGNPLDRSSSPITPQEAEAMIKAKLAEEYPGHPEYANLITGEHEQQVITHNGKVDVVYHPEDVYYHPAQDGIGDYEGRVAAASMSNAPYLPDKNPWPKSEAWEEKIPADIEIIPSSSLVVEQQGQGVPRLRSGLPLVARVRGQGIASDKIRDTSDEVGGIDMNTIDLDREGAGVDIQFDPAELQDIIDLGIDGFALVIINITPLPSVLPLLGLDPANKKEHLEVSSLN